MRILQVFFRKFLRRGAAIFLAGILVAGSLGASTVLADEPAKDPCSVKLEGSESIPGTFPVKDCLTTVGQTSRVPEAGDKNGGVVGILVEAVDLLVKFVGAISLVVFMIGALLTISSEGKEDRLEKGKSAMLYAAIGLVVALFAFILVALTQSLLFFR